ncbi:nascent polypeptide-associated complex subunit alpha, muscle-specific form-like [Microtus ochrogaster]|uniref:Nascent polypeptide-associated complex subunit alpha, muscle-specific form-like n=1 Tax=Microtus ochrogaster TaxID=79684 RepID=A0ABM1AH71_MICOH|nr:nascent polypeptide-associated complex subunit alpha, muscle-specific form-like [Microtus ochrogaster]
MKPNQHRDQPSLPQAAVPQRRIRSVTTASEEQSAHTSHLPTTQFLHPSPPHPKARPRLRTRSGSLTTAAARSPFKTRALRLQMSYNFLQRKPTEAPGQGGRHRLPTSPRSRGPSPPKRCSRTISPLNTEAAAAPDHGLSPPPSAAVSAVTHGSPPRALPSTKSARRSRVRAGHGAAEAPPPGAPQTKPSRGSTWRGGSGGAAAAYSLAAPANVLLSPLESIFQKSRFLPAPPSPKLPPQCHGAPLPEPGCRRSLPSRGAAAEESCPTGSAGGERVLAAPCVRREWSCCKMAAEAHAAGSKPDPVPLASERAPSARARPRLSRPVPSACRVALSLSRADVTTQPTPRDARPRAPPLAPPLAPGGVGGTRPRPSAAAAVRGQVNERPALCADTPSRSAGGAACSACPTRSLSGDGHLPSPPSPPPTAPAPAPGSEGTRHQSPAPPGPPAAPRPGRSGSCRRTCPPGRGEARQTMGLRGRGAARGGGDGRVRGDRVAGLEFGSHPGESRVPPLDNRASRGPARAGLRFHESPGRREGPRAAPRVREEIPAPPARG